MDKQTNFSTEVPIINKSPSTIVIPIESYVINSKVSLSSHDSNSTILRERKSVPNPETWSRDKAKMNRMKGESYIGFRRPNLKSTNKILQDVQRAARVMELPCISPVCKKWTTRLCDSVKQDDCQRLFDDF